MFYFELYDDVRLKGIKHSKKISIVNKAVKLYREKHPINLGKRLLLTFVVCLLPAIILYLFTGVNMTIGWFGLSIFVLNIKLASDETPEVKPYLEQVI